ncbi:hypothetical protein A2803_00170 [Candidatus Woesebacteria bacterium RIFCSPHIGHO2_01_FULL_44_21]|uniref:Uncharacterized protein n=1 Tax=Candidatus Woesebacteria bacterium RIFCSPHIGHO2_01_FULL_44_21 TaxID=1802503 RepID=A0A1F7Z0Z3_9BACT|nr:MAG: hypothetical protein A2803_00170 [Candidatus Woesebacteria bacterium RIFCSPHIGHO2_01_FULL_44_21]OGM71163.1 MAG: hypothetical protein A2897_03025 [Candidatus Woesebacteria bacterium RIFCSPLOWO2_01_FULL_44_24b]
MTPEEWHPRVDNDRKLNPILTLVEELHMAVNTDDARMKEGRLRRLGRALIPHAQNLNSSIDIGEFIRVGDAAIVTKGQYWDWEVAIGDNKYNVRRTDVWNGAGVNISIHASMDNYPDMHICMQKQSGIYYIGMRSNPGPNTFWKSDMAFERPSWRNAPWKKVK